MKKIIIPEMVAECNHELKVETSSEVVSEAEEEKAELRQRFKENGILVHVHDHCRKYPIGDGVRCIQTFYPDWMSQTVRNLIDELVVGFSDDMQDEIADNIVDLVTMFAIDFTGLRHVDMHLYEIYCMLADVIGAEGLREKIDTAYSEVATRYGWTVSHQSVNSKNESIKVVPTGSVLIRKCYDYGTK